MADVLAALFPNVATSHGIAVRVAVSFLAEQSSPDIGRWFWSYHVRIENGRDDTVQLQSRHWRIVDARGNVHEVRGQGVVGEMPVLQPGESYDYVSGCPLDTSAGQMGGTYQFSCQDGPLLTVDIPTFTLLSPVATR